MGQAVPLLVCEGSVRTVEVGPVHLTFKMSFSPNILCIFPERDPLWTPPWSEDDGSETEQLASRHPGLEGHRLLSAGKY